MRKRIVLFAVAFVLSVYCCLNAIAAGEVVSDDAGLNTSGILPRIIMITADTAMGPGTTG